MLGADGIPVETQCFPRSGIECANYGTPERGSGGCATRAFRTEVRATGLAHIGDPLPQRLEGGDGTSAPVVEESEQQVDVLGAAVVMLRGQIACGRQRRRGSIGWRQNGFRGCGFQVEATSGNEALLRGLSGHSKGTSDVGP